MEKEKFKKASEINDELDQVRRVSTAISGGGLYPEYVILQHERDNQTMLGTDMYSGISGMIARAGLDAMLKKANELEKQLEDEFNNL